MLKASQADSLATSYLAGIPIERDAFGLKRSYRIVVGPELWDEMMAAVRRRRSTYRGE